MRLLPALAVALLALALPAGAQAEMVFETHRVATRDGAVVNVDVARDDAVRTSAVLLTYSPYNTINESPGSNTADDRYAARYASQGIARAVADVVGTRDSTGCWDYGGARETRSGVDVVRFLAKRPWANGRVGMIGGSYDGTTATMVAAQGSAVPELKAIVPIAAISRWYGYAYQDGVRFLGNTEEPTDEGFDTPLAFDFGFGRTVGPGVTSDRQALLDRLNPCESAEHTLRGYDRSPDYDAFWLERDFRKNAAKVRAAVLLAHGWQDYNVKQEEATALWPALTGTPFKRLWLTQGTHGGGTDGDGWQPLLDKFLGRFLLGRATGVERTPAVVTQRRTATDGGLQAGAFTSEASWPPAGTTERRLFLSRTGTLRDSAETPGSVLRWTDTGLVTEELSTRAPALQRGWLVQRSAPLTAPLRLAGSAVLDAVVRAPDGGHLAPVLVDIAPDGTHRTIARGFLHLDFRDGLGAAKPAGGAWVRARARMLPQDTTLPAGHRLGLLVQSSNTAWGVPGTPGDVDLRTADSSLRLPVAPAG